MLLVVVASTALYATMFVRIYERQLTRVEASRWVLANLPSAIAAKLTLPDGSKVKFPIDNFAQHCLLNGIDQLGYILSFDDKIKSFEQAHA